MLAKIAYRPNITHFRSIVTSMATSKMKASPYKAQIRLIENLDQGNWIQTRKINYVDPDGKDRVWEMAVRTTRTVTTGLDAVSILALTNEKVKQVVLAKQFRPPCELVVIELPAGLIDPNESVELTAERELIEETGYHGTVKSLSHDVINLFSDPGLTNANMALVTMDIDMSKPENQNPEPELEEGEFIEVFTLPISNLLEGLVDVCRKEGATVDSRLYHLAMGIKLAKELV